MKRTCTAVCTPDPDDSLSKILLDLNLTVAAKELNRLLGEAEERGDGYSDFLTAVLETESTGRFERKLNRSLKRSGLGATKSIDEFDFSIRRKLPKTAVKELLKCRWIVEGRSIICVGRPGTGKTHIAKAIAYAACLLGYTVLYVTAAELLDELYAALADNTYQRVFRRYARVDVLIMEELGYLPLDRHKADLLFRLVSARHPDRSMIVTSNTRFENWGEFFPSKAQGIATIDRLVDRATILRFTGKTKRRPKDIHGEAL